MLNELLVVERGAKQSGITVSKGHPDIKDAGRKPTLLVQLNDKGHPARVQPVVSTVKPWTIRDGQHNSFPYVQLPSPLWTSADGDNWREEFLKKKQTLVGRNYSRHLREAGYSLMLALSEVGPENRF